METVTATVLDADYRRDPLRVRLSCVDDTGSAFVAVDDAFEPYFYALPAADVDPADAAAAISGTAFDVNDEPVRVERVEQVEMVDGREPVTALKVVVAEPPQVPPVQEQVYGLEKVRETREYDVPFYKRYLIDRGITPADTVTLQGAWDGDTFRLAEPPGDSPDEPAALSMLAFDLEVVDDEIIMCSLHAGDFEQVLVTHDVSGPGYVEPVPDEEALISRFVETVRDRDPDILLGYNTDEFDFDVLRDRAEHHGLELALGRSGERMRFQRRGRFAGAALAGRVHLDLYAFVETVISMGLQSDTLTLDAVAEELLGENKDDVSWDEMREYWNEKTNLDVFAKYALRDSELAFRLGESLVPQILSLSRLTGVPPFDVCRHSYGQLVENFLIRKAAGQDLLVPNRPSQQQRSDRYGEGRYAGGFVYTPEQGLHDDIALFDFRSLYPTIIVAHNLSPDTLDVPDCADGLEVSIPEADETYTFCQDTPGFLPAILEDLVRERYELKGRMDDADSQERRDMDTRQNALKILSNAFYGYMGYNGARWYSRGCAEATTALGRRYIQDVIARAEDAGLDVVYGDTDSVFLSAPDIRDVVDAFQGEVNAELPEFMELEYEGYYERGLFTTTDSGEGAKKKYALLAPDGSIKIVGFEQVRRDWSAIAKETQERVIRQVLEDDVDAAVETVAETIERLESGAVPLADLKILTRMKKRPENYQSKTPHSEAAKRAIARGTDISAGDTIEYVITRGSGAISDRAELVDFADSYDASYYVENQVVPVALRVLKVFGYTADQLLGKGKQTGLGRFG